MTLSALAAYGFALLAVYLVLFQLALALGAPWGHLTMAGRWRGALPAAVRPLAVVQGAIAAAMAVAVLQKAGVIAPGWPGWTFAATLVVCVLTVIGNAATPSVPERRLGLPVALGLLTTALIAGFA